MSLLVSFRGAGMQILLGQSKASCHAKLKTVPLTKLLQVEYKYMTTRECCGN